MKRGRILKLLLATAAVAGLLVLPATASAYDGSAPYTWDASVPNYNAAAAVSNGILDPSGIILADFLGRSAAQPNAISYGDSGVSVGWDDAWVGNVGDPNTNGDALDGLWSQIYSDGGWWDLGQATDEVIVFTSQDHGPYVGEGLEYRLFGTNVLWDDASLSAQAAVTAVYLDGWRTHNAAEDINGNGWCSDDIAGVFELDAPYRYIKLVAWDASGGYSEPEVDAMGRFPAQPPVPGIAGWGIAAAAMALLGASAVMMRRKTAGQTA